MSNFEFTKTKDGMVVSVPTEDAVPEISETEATEFVKHDDGTVSVAAQTEREAEPIEDAKVAVGRVAGGMITSAVVDENIAEVSWDDVKSPVGITSDVEQSVNALVGFSKTDVETALNKLVENSKIGSFRILDPGQSYATTDYVPNRVQASSDKDGVIQTIEIG